MKIAILGRQTQLSLAELISLYGPNVRADGPVAQIETDDIALDILGGSLKIAHPIAEFDHSSWSRLCQNLLTQVGWEKHFGQTKQKLNLSLSVYNTRASDRQITGLGLQLKQVLRTQCNLNVRLVPSRGGSTNAASIIHNRILQSGADIIIAPFKRRWLIALTTQVQDIDKYALRDHGRPSRNAKIGLLPPKLAQILLNLTRPPANATVLDPFCGGGVVLQEALLRGWNVMGSDKNPLQVEASRQNLRWLRQHFRISAESDLTVADATSAHWAKRPDAVAAEIDLGPALATPQTPIRLAALKRQAENLTEAFLANLAPQIQPSTPVGLALPAWRVRDHFQRLDIVDRASSLGYTIKQFQPVPQQDLIYWRTDQLVGRELIILTKAA
jgi:tRNA G10  N-methylase Trm11